MSGTLRRVRVDLAFPRGNAFVKVVSLLTLQRPNALSHDRLASCASALNCRLRGQIHFTAVCRVPNKRLRDRRLFPRLWCGALYCQLWLPLSA